MVFPSQYSQYTDESLIQLISQRNSDALEELYNRYAQMVHNLIVHIVDEHATADELLQETFWQVWQKAGAYAGRGAVTACFTGLRAIKVWTNCGGKKPDLER